MIYVLADIQHKYDDAVIYAADMLASLETDFNQSIIEKISGGIYTTVGALYLSYSVVSDFYQSKISRTKKAMINLK